MSSGSFIGSVQQFLADMPGLPWFLRRKNVARFLEAVALGHDGALESMRQGFRLSQPLRCDESALPVLSRDRGIRLYTTEPVASQRYRLSQWWQLRRQFGTHQGQMRNLRPYFLTASSMPVMRVVHQDGRGVGGRATWHTLDAAGNYSYVDRDPSNFNYDGQGAKWSRFFFILYSPASMLNLVRYDDGSVYDGGATYDGILQTDVALEVIAAVREAKAAHSRLQAFILATDPTSFDPAATPAQHPDGWWTLPFGNWGSPIDANGVYTRPPTSFWLYEAGVN